MCVYTCTLSELVCYIRTSAYYICSCKYAYGYIHVRICMYP